MRVVLIYEMYKVMDVWIVHTTDMDILLGFDTPEGAQAYVSYCNRLRLFETPVKCKKIEIRKKFMQTNKEGIKTIFEV